MLYTMPLLMRPLMLLVRTPRWLPILPYHRPSFAAFKRWGTHIGDCFNCWITCRQDWRTHDLIESIVGHHLQRSNAIYLLDDLNSFGFTSSAVGALRLRCLRKSPPRLDWWALDRGAQTIQLNKLAYYLICKRDDCMAMMLFSSRYSSFHWLQ